MKALIDYTESLRNHITYVKFAGLKLGLPDWRYEQHDTSKFSQHEIHAYANNFFGAKDNPEGFAYAWLHHIHNNPHHWQYWVFPGDYPQKGSEYNRLAMPPHYAVEMVADWLGASKAYTDSWDMTDWIFKNYDSVILHSLTLAFVNDLLSLLGYESMLLELGHLPKHYDTTPDPAQFAHMPPMESGWYGKTRYCDIVDRMLYGRPRDEEK